MTPKTLQTLTTRLCDEIMRHPHREELIELMLDQLCDDTLVLPQPTTTC